MKNTVANLKFTNDNWEVSINFDSSLLKFVHPNMKSIHLINLECVQELRITEVDTTRKQARLSISDSTMNYGVFQLDDLNKLIACLR